MNPIEVFFEISEDILNLGERRSQVVSDLLCEQVRIGKIGGILEAFVAKPEKVEAHLVPRAKDLEGRGRFGPGKQTELQAHRLGLHQRGHVFHLGHRDIAADAPYARGGVDARRDTRLQQALNR